MTRTVFTLSGIVQAVGFRYAVARIAARHDVAGTVRNVRAGERVEIDVQGSADAVEAFMQDVFANPPPGARVTGVERRGDEPRALRTFSEAPTM
jgi:hydrogenase maturation protein HypF